MARIDTRRMTHRHEGPLVVFHIGMTINRWTRPRQWWPVAAAVAAAMGGARAVTSLRLRRRELRQEVLAEVAFRSGCAKP